MMFWIECEMCMGIVVANGPALKVFFKEMGKKQWLPFRISLTWVTKSITGSMSSSFSNTRNERLQEKAPRLKTVDVSRFQVTQLMSDAELKEHLSWRDTRSATLRPSERDSERSSDRDSDGWSFHLATPAKVYTSPV
jgi:hypothetical protein